MMRSLFIAFVLSLAVIGSAVAQTICPTSSNFQPEFVDDGSVVFQRSATQWNQYFGSKTDANNGVACNLTLGGTTNVDMFNATTSFNATGLVKNSDLVSPSILVNGQTCVLGSACTINQPTATIIIGTTAISGSPNGYVLYNNGGLLGSKVVSASDVVTVGTTQVANSTDGDVLYNNAGVLGNRPVGTTGANTIIMTTGGGLLDPSILPLATNAANGAVKGDGSTVNLVAGVLSANNTTINGTPCTPGGSCTVTSGMAVGTTPITGGTPGYLLYNSGGILSNVAPLAGVNPTAIAGPTAINGTSISYMRADAAPAIQKASSSLFGIAEVDGSTITAASGVITTANTTINGITCTPGSSCITNAPLVIGSSTGNSLIGPSEIFVCVSTCTVTPPVPVAGYRFCVMNDDNVNTVITLGAIGSSAKYEVTARTGYGTAGTGTFTSAGAVGDLMCLVGRDSTHYLTERFTGTWVAS